MTATPIADLTGSLNAPPLDSCRPPTAAGARLTLIATIGYAVAWIAGLTVFASSTQVERQRDAGGWRPGAATSSPAALQYAADRGRHRPLPDHGDLGHDLGPPSPAGPAGRCG